MDYQIINEKTGIANTNISSKEAMERANALNERYELNKKQGIIENNHEEALGRLTRRNLKTKTILEGQIASAMYLDDFYKKAAASHLSTLEEKIKYNLTTFEDFYTDLASEIFAIKTLMMSQAESDYYFKGKNATDDPKSKSDIAAFKNMNICGKLTNIEPLPDSEVLCTMTCDSRHTIYFKTKIYNFAEEIAKNDIILTSFDIDSYQLDTDSTLSGTRNYPIIVCDSIIKCRESDISDEYYSKFYNNTK